LNDCFYCQTSHGAIASQYLGGDQELVDKVKKDFGSAPISEIAALLDSAEYDLSNGTFIFSLSSGFTGFSDAPGLIQFNRALAARVAIYRQQWSAALTNLSASFFNLNGDFNAGVFHEFSTRSGDQLNSAFFPQNQTGEVRLAHPSYAADIEPGDDRIGKATLRTVAASLDGLSSNRDLWVYTSSTAPVPMIRNEELILIFAEASIQTSDNADALMALNIIRNEHNLPNYSGPQQTDSLIAEKLLQRRYSLFDEGHRWIDLRRYNLLGQLPIDRPGDHVWAEFSLPLTEQ